MAYKVNPITGALDYYEPAGEAGEHDHDEEYEPIDATILRQADVDDTPVDEATTAPVSSNWAYNHNHDAAYSAVGHDHDDDYAPISVTAYSATLIILSKSSSVSQNVGGANGTEVWWTWDGEVRKDTGFTHSNGTNPERIQVDADGWYKITFMGNAQQTGANRTTLQGIYRINGGATIRSGSIRNYTRGAGYGNVSPGLCDIVELTNGDYIEVGTRVEDTDATYTITAPDGTEVTDDECRLIVELVP